MSYKGAKLLAMEQVDNLVPVTRLWNLLLVPLILALAVNNSVVMTTAPKSGTAKFLVWSAYTEELQHFYVQSFRVNNSR
jgi:hypothetical protein